VNHDLYISQLGLVKTSASTFRDVMMNYDYKLLTVSYLSGNCALRDVFYNFNICCRKEPWKT